jgi:hypothetical protein
MSDRLTIDDADGLRDLGDRSRRAARTARRAAGPEFPGEGTLEKILAVASCADRLADAAYALADWLERGGPNRAAEAPGAT